MMIIMKILIHKNKILHTKKNYIFYFVEKKEKLIACVEVDRIDLEEEDYEEDLALTVVGEG